MPVAHAAWSAPPVVLAVTAVAAALFVQGWLRLRGRGRRDHASWRRLALFALGLAVALAGIVTPIDSLGEDELLSLHMLQHVLIGDLAVALCIVAMRGPLFVFMLPPRVLAPVARSRLRRGTRVLLGTYSAWILHAAALWAWHVPALYDAALEHDALHDLEHACWVVAGILVWTLLVDPGSHGRLSKAGRVALAAAMFGCGQILTDVLVFSFHGLYPAYEGAFGLSARTDQQLAGLVMMVEQLLTLGTLVLLLLRPRVESRSVVTA